MKCLESVLIVFIVILGCESTPKTPTLKTLNWNKTAIEQKLEIGDTIIVEGLAYNIIEYRLTQRRIYPHFNKDGPPSYAVHVPTLYRERWGEEISLPLYNPEQPNVEENPKVPIGSVVCVIFNPKHEENLMTLHEMYPAVVRQETSKEAFRSGSYKAKYESQWSSDYIGVKKRPHFQHRLRFTGSIRGFSRKTLRSVSLPCIDLVVSGIEVISSKTSNELEDWRTEVKIFADTVIEIGDEIIVK